VSAGDGPWGGLLGLSIGRESSFKWLRPSCGLTCAPACNNAAAATLAETNAPRRSSALTLRGRALDGRPAARRSAAAPSWIRHEYLCEQTEDFRRGQAARSHTKVSTAVSCTPVPVILARYQITRPLLRSGSVRHHPTIFSVGNSGFWFVLFRNRYSRMGTAFFFASRAGLTIGDDCAGCFPAERAPWLFSCECGRQRQSAGFYHRNSDHVGIWPDYQSTWLSEQFPFSFARCLSTECTLLRARVVVLLYHRQRCNVPE
jgi:hypothetical protein